MWCVCVCVCVCVMHCMWRVWCRLCVWWSVCMCDPVWDAGCVWMYGAEHLYVVQNIYVCVCDAVYVCLWCSVSDVVCMCVQQRVSVSVGRGNTQRALAPLSSRLFILWSPRACPLGFSGASQRPREQHISLRLPCLPAQACHSGSVSSVTEAV